MHLSWETIFTEVTTSDGASCPATGWMDATSLKGVRGSFEVASSTDASGVIRLGVQFANTENDPQTAIILPDGQTRTGNGTAYPTQMSMVAGDAEGYQLARLVWFFKGSSAGLKVARVCAKVDIDS